MIFDESFDKIVPPTEGYRTILIDPPWHYGKWGKANKKSRPNSKEYPMPYDTMSVEDIKRLDIMSLANENCELYMWTTNKYLQYAFDIISGWGFKYCQTLTWCKAPRGTGQGGIYCPTTEFLILGRRGRMPDKKRLDSTWWKVKREHNAHSKKPEHFQDMIEIVSDGKRIELFARRERPGWDCWGNEVYNV